MDDVGVFLLENLLFLENAVDVGFVVGNGRVGCIEAGCFWLVGDLDALAEAGWVVFVKRVADAVLHVLNGLIGVVSHTFFRCVISSAFHACGGWCGVVYTTDTPYRIQFFSVKNVLLVLNINNIQHTVEK